MINKIEIFDQRRKKIRGRCILGDIVFFMAWVTRSVLKTTGIQAETLYSIVMIVLLLSILWMGYFGVKLLNIEHKIKKDPVLNNALYNELVRLNELKSWKIAFFSMIIFNIISAYLIISVPIKDPMLLIVTGLLIGFGSVNISIYFLDK